MNILITGATGNVGVPLIANFQVPLSANNLFAGVRDIEKAKKANVFPEGVEFRVFDFEDPSTFSSALKDIDIIFLLRPPHISNIDKYFMPLVKQLVECGVEKVVFLSVQGAEKSKVIPHRKIELLLLEHDLEYIFMRPSYFMQNLTTTLYNEISSHRTISLPSGDAKFNWIDIEDIAKMGVKFIAEFERYKNNAYEITGDHNLNFAEVVAKINKIADSNIVYNPVSPFRFFLIKKKEGLAFGMIIVMLILHYLPRIQTEPIIVKTVYDILNTAPSSIDDFILRNKQKFS